MFETQVADIDSHSPNEPTRFFFESNPIKDKYQKNFFMNMIIQRFHDDKRIKYILLFPLYLLVFFVLVYFIPEKYYVDWVSCFRPAVWDILSLRTPYEGHGVYNPPWGFIPLIPLALFPPRVGAILLTLVTLFSILFIALRLGAKSYVAISLLLVPQIGFKAIVNPNIDFLAAFGLILPPQIGLFFLAIKPQIGIGVAIFWLVEAWKDGGWKKVVKVFAPVTIAFSLSIIIFGPYMQNSIHLTDHEEIPFSYPLWPYTIPVGLSLLALAISRREFHLSISSSQFLSPYVAFYTYPFALLGIVNYQLVYWSTYIGMWLVFIFLN